MFKNRRIKIRYLLIIGITIIFASSIIPLIMISVDSVRGLGEFATNVGGRAIEKGSTLLFLERVKAKSEEYSKAFLLAEKYVDILQVQMNTAYSQLEYYAYPDTDHIDYLKTLKSNNDNVIEGHSHDGVHFWYWGDNTGIPDDVAKDIDFFSMYFPFITEIGKENKYFSSSWFDFIADKILFAHYSFNPEMPNRSEFSNYMKNFRYDPDKWTPIYKDISGKVITTISKTVYSKEKKAVGKVGIDINVDNIIQDSMDSVNTELIIKNKSTLLPKDNKSLLEEYEPFTFILNENMHVIKFPVKYYKNFGLNLAGMMYGGGIPRYKFGKHKFPQIVKLLDDMKKNSSGYDILEFKDGQDYLVAYSRMSANNWILGVVLPLDYLLDPVKKTKAEIEIITRDLMFALAIMALMFFIIAVFLMLVVFKEYLMNPINNLTKGINDIIKAKFKGCLVIDGAPEITDLAETFNHMTEELNVYMDNLKNEIKDRERVESEMQTARKIQEALLPRITDIFLNRDFDINAKVIPAKTVAGDFYDYFFVTKDRLAFLVGDVSGKGVSSAFYMTLARSIVRDCCQQESIDPAKAVTNINKILFDEYKADMFVSMVLIYYDVNTGEGRYVNAGHPDVVLINEEGVCGDLAREEGLILAFSEDSEYRSVPFKLDYNEILVLYSDGILEPYNDDLGYFRAELIKLLNENYTLSIKEFSKNVISKIKEKDREDREDDFTLLIFRREHGGINRIDEE